MLNDLPLMSFVRDKMKWHQARQAVLASNVAHADTPNYKPKDLKALTFAQHIPEDQRPQTGMKATHQRHMSVGASFTTEFEGNRSPDFEVTPSGNGVVLEDQMAKVAQNQMDYQMATTVYSRSLGLIKMAIGRG